MREHPILFSAPMIIAIQEERKTVTRRTSERWDKVQPGDLLWAKETFAIVGEGAPDAYPEIHYRADGKSREFSVPSNHSDLVDNHFPYPGPWKPSIFMPRAHSRITLEVVSVRKERLQEITESEAELEGFAPTPESSAVGNFATLWAKLNAKTHPWDSNPLVRRIEFRRVG